MNEQELNVKDLSRFLTAQERDYATALAEIQNGRKRSHWMWYIFPQIAGLGNSETSKFYALKNRQEAEAYLSHSVLGRRLVEISNALIHLEDNHATRIFGSPDDLKLKSSMTLFNALTDTDPIFSQVLAKFYNGIRDWETLRLLDESK
ncbi:Uncharacterized protein, DUF1810 family [Mucilaginibacter lappiensis]|uniref:Uncharacterized protein (DUF1810 family) n=1 Tax=Mucilaginibacter lappiensis TaxID=354630 RepID=A0ABR6PGA0_9SPHI|nr:DUF1810 domain-containing protein [Mucilaginibacter lappiensis]MBB6108628.1 uncharacterized protein (DUF1810 family) [Mucilaginibacter lappiensis]SIQ30309.1 Uncharacterized protein, DUF1810 family [Mucilaginibacter lappiensis]